MEGQGMEQRVLSMEGNEQGYRDPPSEATGQQGENTLHKAGTGPSMEGTGRGDR